MGSVKLSPYFSPSEQKGSREVSREILMKKIIQSLLVDKKRAERIKESLDWKEGDGILAKIMFVSGSYACILSEFVRYSRIVSFCSIPV